MNEDKRKKDRDRKAAKKKQVKQRQKTGATDIRKHTCTREVEGSVMSGKTKIIRYRCSVCHVSMGTKKEQL